MNRISKVLRYSLLCGVAAACSAAEGSFETAAEGTEGTEQQQATSGLRYDNLPDIGEFVVDGRAWTNTNLTYFFQNGTADIAGTAEQAAILTAIRFWEEQSPLRFSAAASAAAADIVIQFASGDHSDGFPFDGTNGVLAHAFYPPPNGGALAGDAHFDDAETWTDAVQASGVQPIDLLTVAAHEFGHSLGLAHSSTTGALMQPFYVGSQRFLGVDDIAGIQDIYGDNTFPETDDNYATAVAMGDFNGDGFDDLAVGVPRQSVSGQGASGAVNVQYASANGSPAVQLITQDSFEVAGTAEAGDFFGAAVAAGDFDNDGFDDLAVGVPGEAVGSASDAGSVVVLYGSVSGLNGIGSQGIHQGSGGVEGSAEAGDQFGSSLAVGDFNNDGRDDLVIGVPNEAVGTAAAAGTVHVIPGSTTGLVPANDLRLQEGSGGVVGVATAGDEFGASVAAGDLNGDGFDDLVIGIPGDDVSGQNNAGAVHVLRGSSALITTTGNAQWHQNSANVPGSAEPNDAFGSSVAVGRFNGDTFADLAVGSPGEDSGPADAGYVHFLYGSSSGVTGTGSININQDTANVTGTAVTGGAFGSSLATGNFNGDTFTDIVIGVPGDTVSGATDAGSAYVFFGSATGPSTANEVYLHQDTSGVGGASEANDSFGYSVATGDWNGDGLDDVTVGAVNEAIGSVAGAGTVHVILGTSGGITTTGSLRFAE